MFWLPREPVSFFPDSPCFFPFSRIHLFESKQLRSCSNAFKIFTLATVFIRGFVFPCDCCVTALRMEIGIYHTNAFYRMHILHGHSKYWYAFISALFKHLNQGGFRAVVWTDTLQTFYMTAGALTITILGLYKIGGFTEVWERNEKSGRIEFFK